MSLSNSPISDKFRPFMIIYSSSRRRQKMKGKMRWLFKLVARQEERWKRATAVLPWVPLNIKYLIFNKPFSKLKQRYWLKQYISLRILDWKGRTLCPFEIERLELFYITDRQLRFENNFKTEKVSYVYYYYYMFNNLLQQLQDKIYVPMYFWFSKQNLHQAHK